MKIIRLFDNRQAFKLLVFGLLLITAASCRKDEFQSAPEGEVIPYDEPKNTLQEVLQASSNTLFKAAWKRSNMDNILKTKWNKQALTLLVPTDEAFIADGLTLEVINQTSPEKLDEILLYHTVLGNVNPKGLVGRIDNTIEKSLLENPALRVPPIGGVLHDKYYYRQYLKLDGANLHINGKLRSNKPAILAKDGVFWVINQVLHKPTKTIIEALQADPRFSIYLEVMQMNDDAWMEASEYNYPRDFTFGWRINDYGEMFPNITFNTVFAPTNEAFHRAGFANAQAVMKLNADRPQPGMDWNTWMMTPGVLSTDSLVTMHRMDNLFTFLSIEYFSPGRLTSNTFYSGDLNNALLSNYVVRLEERSTHTPAYIMPLEFGKNADGSVKVKVKESTQPEATIVDGDINTLMGPIHAVDRLIVPKGFKF